MFKQKQLTQKHNIFNFEVFLCESIKQALIFPVECVHNFVPLPLKGNPAEHLVC